MTVHSLTHSELAREAKRRGLVLTRPPVPLTPEEDRAIRLLVLAAESLQAGRFQRAYTICGEACSTLLPRGCLAPLSRWLFRFTRECAKVSTSQEALDWWDERNDRP